MVYFLYFEDFCLGTVEVKDEEFPNIWGDFQLDDSFKLNNKTEVKRIKKYIKLSTQESDLVDKMHLMDLTQEFEELNKQFEPLMDLIESEDWYLVDNQKKKFDILAPSFKSDNSIVWRWKN